VAPDRFSNSHEEELCISLSRITGVLANLAQKPYITARRGFLEKNHSVDARGILRGKKTQKETPPVAYHSAQWRVILTVEAVTMS